MSAQPTISIVIVNYETSTMVRRCVQSLREQGIAHTVTIVDNPSPANDIDNLHELVTPGAPGISGEVSTVCVVRAEANLGYGLGCNLGLADNASPYVCILNPDTLIPPGTLDRWLESLRREEDAAAAIGSRPPGLLAPLLLNDNGTPQRSTYQFQNAANYWLYHSLLAGILKTLRKHVKLSATTSAPFSLTDRALPVDWAMGAAYLLPRHAWERIGGFSDAYFLYAEDTDLCWRLRQVGYEVLFDPSVAIIHTQGEPSAERRGMGLVRLFRGLHTFIHQRYGFWRRSGVRVSVIADMLLRIAIYTPLAILRPGHVLTRSRLQGSREVLRMFWRK